MPPQQHLTLLQKDLRAMLKPMGFIGRLPEDLEALLLHYHLPRTFQHCLQVSELAVQLAERFSVERVSAQTAGWLHDCSAIVPGHQRLLAAERWRLDVLPEEDALPLLLHQKLSVVLAEGIFGIQDAAVLSAIGCHTTLKAGASSLDKVVFIADKLAWDQPGTPPYAEAVWHGLDQSLDAGVLVYLNYLYERRAALHGPLHPWLVQARSELVTRVSGWE